MLAARNDHEPAVRALLYADADFAIRGPKGETALSIATERKWAGVVELLRKAGALN